MITDSFDTSKPIIAPKDFVRSKGKVCDTCIATFSFKVLKYFLSTFKCTKLGSMNNISEESFVYSFDYNGKTYGLFQIRVGAPPAAMDLLEAQEICGATNFITFGSAGSLDASKTTGKYIIPTESYRDEGLSYHYAPASDYIQIKNSSKVASIFSKLGIPYQEGRVWTTDALFKETEIAFSKRKNDGCIAVDMEVSALQAVCDYHGFNYYTFLETGDVLSTIEYDVACLDNANHKIDKLIIALKLAENL